MAVSDQVEGAPIGVGEAAGGRVRAEVDTDGLLERLRLNPRVLQVGSEELAEHIVSAVRTAQQDWLSRTDGPDASAVQLPEGLDSGVVVRRLEEMQSQADLGFLRLTATLDETLRRLDER